MKRRDSLSTKWNSRLTFFCRVCFHNIGGCTCTHGDAAMQQRSFSAGLTLYLILVILAIAGLSAGLSIQASAQTGQSASSAESYILGPNDRIRLKVYGEPDITGEYEISNSGQVSIPLAGHIKAAGATTRQLEKSIASALAKGIVRDPRVNVEIAQYRPYYILGEVKKSGEYPYRHGLTVLDAVASAGGFTYRANENKVFLRRAGAGAEETYPLDAPVPVYPGDNIRVPERYF
ncbi:polysaccharide biosynthesis/export family protein [Bradyrhizobium sp. CB3481]|uniref:polysaccharide biosynthesis/export family protein n=1 Tax=Bradyrhizobium sp. CB3481 TaxID=3039158 RepID=UPI0024B1F7E1|nr:polysaccharide biosynthesis/export family protein [Bradyrhizobium sp. CB3481]WFU17714.1 polysaccharide export protein [Bradyrhizobium sp. CB3481]